jgi:hypothetical protein
VLVPGKDSSEVMAAEPTAAAASNTPHQQEAAVAAAAAATTAAGEQQKSANSWIMNQYMYSSEEEGGDSEDALSNEPVSPAAEYQALCVAMHGHIQAAAAAKKEKNTRGQKEAAAKIKGTVLD